MSLLNLNTGRTVLQLWRKKNGKPRVRSSGEGSQLGREFDRWHEGFAHVEILPAFYHEHRAQRCIVDILAVRPEPNVAADTLVVCGFKALAKRLSFQTAHFRRILKYVERIICSS